MCRSCKKGTSRKLTPEQGEQVQKTICDKSPEQMRMDFALWTRKTFLVRDNLKVFRYKPVKEWLERNTERIEVFSLPATTRN